MKQTARRILSLVLSFVMLVSMMTVFTSAANNFVPDDEYYDNIHNTSYIVIPNYNKYTVGDKVTYVFRGKTYTEDFDPTIHFGTIQDAFDAYMEQGMRSPVIALAAGTFIESTVITDSVTLIGSNGGINPMTKGANPNDVWTENKNRDTDNESAIKGVIFVKKTVKQDIEVKFDGVSLIKGFSYIETGSRENKSTVYCENTIINGAGNASYDQYAASDVFSFSNSTKTENEVFIKNSYVKNMSSSNVVGVGITTFSAENVFFTASQGGLMGGADAPANQEPNYTITNCMFYNNNSTLGVISLDHSLNDNATRTISTAKISNCWFIDGPNTGDTSKVSPIYITVAGTKNELDVTDCYFEGKHAKSVDDAADLASIISIGLSAGAKTAELKNKIRANNNICIGYPTVPDTTSMSPSSAIDFTGNFYALSNAEQCDPVYPSSSSYSNVYMEYFFINEAMTIKSSQFEIKSLGIKDAKLDHVKKTVDVTVDFDYKAKVNIQAKDPNTTFTLYDSTMTNVVKEIDASKLISGVKKNVFYAVSKSTTYPFYSSVYKVYVSTYDPAKALVFDLKDHYMLSAEVAGLPNGTEYFTAWDGIAYKFIVGKTVFENIEDIYNVSGENVPTVIMAAGSYSKTIRLTKSTILLGAKHGINPNIPDFENPDLAWQLNPERQSADQETVLRAVIAYEPESPNTYIVVDGFTLGSDFAFADVTNYENTYTTSYIDNCIVDGATTGKYETNNTQMTLSAIFNVGTASEGSTAYKTFRLKNLRMVGQLTAVPLGSYFNRLIMDGCYVAENTHSQLFTNEVTAPKGQDFYFELKNSCFYKNVTTTYYFVINHSSTNSAARKQNLVVFDNNTFYETNSNVNGIFGIRWQGSRDYHVFTNNNFISSTATAFIPGYENWFIGKSGHKASEVGAVDTATLEPLKRENNIYKNNRFIGKVINSTPNIIYTHPDTVLDFSENYFASSYGKSVAGTVIKMTTTDKTFCDSYYKDYAMTEMSTPSEEFKTALDYEFLGADKATKTFTDTAKDTATTYEFKYELATPQASMKVYTDAACTNLVSNPVTLSGGDNVFYVKFASYDGTVKDVYTATITKKASTGAAIEKFGSWKIQGKSIFACVPVGETTFKLPEIVVSVGASYGVYNNSACTSVFKENAITGIREVPTQKFIKVISQDGKTVNVYTLTVLQTENDQAELAGVTNGKRTSDTLFTATTDSSEYVFVPEVSEGATVKVLDGKDEIVKNADGSYTVDSIFSEKTVNVIVTSAKGVSNTFSVRILKGSDSTAIQRIHNMATVGSDTSEYVTYIAEPIFEVKPVFVSDQATFKLYSDYNCTKELKSTTLVLTKRDTVAYMKVTSADGENTEIVKLSITSALIASDDTPVEDILYEIKDAVEDDNIAELYTITVPANTSKYTLNVNVKDQMYAATTFAAFADPACSIRLAPESPINTPIEIALTGRNTRVYFRIYVKKDMGDGGTPAGIKTQYPVLDIVSPRSKVTYKDQSKIANWAADEIAYLNDNGFGYFVGDANGNFNAASSINRYEVAVVVAKILGVNAEHYKTKRNPFYDEIPKWAHPYVVAVKELGIMSGKDGNMFAGNDPTTRQEFARIIAGTLAILNCETGTIDEIYEKNKTLVDFDYAQYTFVDEKDVAKWAASAIKLSVSYYKVMSGSAENGKLYLNPKKAITRQEVAVLVANLSGYNG